MSPPVPEEAVPAPLVIEPIARRVTQAGRSLGLGDRALDLLMVLAGDPGQVFSADALKAAVWPGRVIEDQNLRMQVLALRKALADPQAVLTVPGRGYRLMVPVHWSQPQSGAGQVPHWPEPLLGRDADLAELMRLVGEHRLVTILGAGGIGKTRLAQRLVQERQARYRQGVWWVDLATLHARGGAVSVPALARATAQAMGLPAGSLQADSAAAQLGTMLAAWQTLLLLDSAEHLAGPDGPLLPLVRTLLGAAGGLRVLVTSQQALGLPEEWVYRLDTLAVPAPGATADQVLESPAVQLLLRRARAVDQAFALPPADVPLAGAVARRLDGIALAIEMAAVRLPLLGAPALLAHLETRLPTLAGHDQVAPPRQRTLRATLDWSHALLSPAEQAALRQLSVFAAPFRVDAARYVIQPPGGDEAAAMQLVQALLDKSLLQRRPGGSDGVPVRLRLLQSTRAFASETLQSRPAEAQASRRRHAQAMAALARESLDDLYRCSDAVWQARWWPDHEDLALGFDHAHALGDADSGAPIIELLVRGAMITGQADWATDRWEASRELAQQAAPLARAILLGWGNNRLTAGQTRLEGARERLQVWRELKDIQRECGALSRLAVACEHEGDRAGADAALQACEALEDPAWSPRMRTRGVINALEEIAPLRNDPALHQRLQVLLQRIVPELQALGADVELQAIQTRRLPLLCVQGQFDEALQVVQSMSAAAARRHLPLSEGVFHGYGMVAWLGQADAAPAGGHALAQSRAAALRMLTLLAAGPPYLRLFSAPMAWLALRLGDAELAATLLAASRHLQQSEQLAASQLDLRHAQRVQAALPAGLDADALERARAAGERLTPDSLRLLALQRLGAGAAED